MKNIILYRISLTLIGLLCSGGQANNIFSSLGELKNMPNFAAIDEFVSKSIPLVLSNIHIPLYKTVKIIDELFDSLTLNFSVIRMPDTNTVKTTARNANTDRTKLPENTNVTIKSNNVTESHTQPNIYYSIISNSTPINGRSINNNTNQNNGTYLNKFYCLLCALFTWPEYSTIKKQYNEIVEKFYTVNTTLLLRRFIASIVSLLKNYWLLGRGIFQDFIKTKVGLYVLSVVFCGMLLLPVVYFRVARKLLDSRGKLTSQQENASLFMV